MELGQHTLLAMKSADKERVYFAEKQTQETIKKARQARRQRKRKLDEEKDPEDDPSYVAGLF